MAVKIRLKRMGKIRQPYYRIVVADSRTKRDGRVIEEIGKYHPKEDPSIIEVDSERAQHWLSVGAQPSEPVAVLLKLTGDWQKFKGEAAPGPLKVAEPGRTKADRYNDAVKDLGAEPKSKAEPVSSKSPRKRAAEPKAEEPKVEEQKAAESKTEEQKVEEPKVDEPAAAEPQAEASVEGEPEPEAEKTEG